MENNFEEYKRALLAACDKELEDPELETKIALRKRFLEEYPLERLKTMELEEYAIGRESRDSFCYNLERGRYANVGLGIRGGNAVKFGIYYDKFAKNYRVRDRGMRNKPAENPEKFWQDFRTQLVDFLEEVMKPKFVDDFVVADRFPLLNGTGIVLTKLCFLYRPDIFANFSHHPAVFALKNLGVADPARECEYDRTRLAFAAAAKLREKIPELYSGKYDPQVIGDANFRLFKASESSDLKAKTYERVTKDIDSDADNEDSRLEGGENVIYYGTPGCGKSYLVNQLYGKSDRVIRTVFHPDYTNSDFVGQIVPSVSNEGNVSYRLAPGPFTRALEYAIAHPTEKVVLIVDEINRGNSAAIFGDLLQILDRDPSGAGVYDIANDFISSYLAESDREVPDITLPSNLWIIATMNTSDQNVFPLDTAFKRRWKMVKVRNDFTGSKIGGLFVPGTDVTWKTFVEKINNKIARTESFGLNSEDKQLGVYFMPASALSETENEEDAEKIKEFGEKILMYLWEDVAKLERSQWFGDKFHALDELLDEFEKSKLAVFNDLFETEHE